MIQLNKIEKEFDKKFSHCFNVGVVPDDITKENIKQFYHEKIQEIVKEMVGEKQEYCNYGEHIDDNGWFYSKGYNAKRQEIIKIAKKYNIKL